MSRLDELKDRIKEVGGFLGLSKEEKEEYKRLKDGDVAKPLEEKITISKSELDGIVANAVKRAMNQSNMDDGKLFGKWEEFKEEGGNNQTATLKVWHPDSSSQKGIIIKQDSYKTILNPENNRYDLELYKITVLYDDGKTEELEVDVRKLASINSVERVELVKVDRKKLVKVDGSVVVTPKNKQGYTVRRADNGYGSKGGGFEVPLEVVKWHETFTIKRPNGQTLEIEGKYLNN